MKPLVPIGLGVLLGATALLMSESEAAPFPRRISDAEAARRIAAAYPASASIATVVVAVARAIGADPFDLANLINFESRFDHQAVNSRTGATGLIQFMPATAAELLGTTQSAAIAQIAAMTPDQQMIQVRRFLERWHRIYGDLDTPHKMAMSVFWPAYIDDDPNTLFPARVPASNPGIYTPEDYVQYMTRNARLPRSDQRVA